jgi:protein O-mannosyl-transferase
MPSQSFGTARTKYLPPLILSLVVAGVFWPVCMNDFVRWDDTHNVVNNPHFQSHFIKNISYFWTHAYKDLYVPLTYSVWAAIIPFAKLNSATGTAEGMLNPHIFHAINWIFHVLSALTVYMILRHLVPSAWAAFFGAMFFGLHPVQVEPVAWISGMKDVLCGLLSLVAIWQYVIFARSHPPEKKSSHQMLHFILGNTRFYIGNAGQASRRRCSPDRSNH